MGTATLVLGCLLPVPAVMYYFAEAVVAGTAALSFVGCYCGLILVGNLPVAVGNYSTVVVVGSNFDTEEVAAVAVGNFGTEEVAAVAVDFWVVAVLLFLLGVFGTWPPRPLLSPFSFVFPFLPSPSLGRGGRTFPSDQCN